MVREFEIPLGDANIEDAHFRLDNERDENGNPVPHREWATGIDREGSAARMAVKGRMPVVAHGFESPGSKTPVTLVVLEWSTERLRLDKRFREVTLEVSFAAHGSRRDAEPEAQRLREKGVGRQHWDPEVLALAPEGTSWYHRTTHAVLEKEGLDLSMNFTFGGVVSFGPRVYWERGDAVNRTDGIQLSGSRAVVGPGHSRPNAVRWVMLENESQQSGVPAFLRTAVLLRRRPKDNGQFLGTVKVSYRVSPLYDFKETLFKAVGKLPVDTPIVFDPKVATTVQPSVNLECLGEFDVGKEFKLVSLEPLLAAIETAAESVGGPNDTACVIEGECR